EDGIRDRNVTGVQTCALPILTVGVGLGCFLGLAELGADVAGEVLGGGDETLGGGVVVDQGAELFAGLVRGEAAEAGNLVEVDSAVGVQGDGEGVVDGVGALCGVAAGDGAALEEVGGARGLGVGVELLEGVDERGEGVAAEDLGGGGVDRDHVLGAGLAGAPGGVEAVDGAVGVLVVLPGVAQGGALRGQLRAVSFGLCLGL